MSPQEALAQATIKPKRPIYCNFCGARDDEVECMIAANLDTNICINCVDQCAGIIKAHRDAKRGEAEYTSWFFGTLA